MASWFEQPEVEASIARLDRAAGAKGGPNAAAPAPQRLAVAVGGGAMGLLMLALGLFRLATLGSADADAFAFHLISALGLLAAAPGVGWYVWLALRDTSSAADFERIAEEEGMALVRGAPLVRGDVGVVPWFDTDELVTDIQRSVEVHLAGAYRGHRVAYVECCHVVDPLAGNRLLRSTGVLVLNRGKRLALRGMDAVVSLEPVDLPDLVVVPRTDPSIAHYQRALTGPEVTDLPAELARTYWVASSEPTEAARLLRGPLGALLADMEWCIVQVIGGYRVFFGSHRSRNVVAPAPRAEDAIDENLELADQVFQALSARGALQAAAPSTASVPRDEDDEDDDDDEDTAGGTVLGWVVRATGGAVGLTSLLLCAIVLLYAVPKHIGSEASLAWPSTTAVVAELRLEPHESRKGTEYSPRVKYDYEVDGASYEGRNVQYGMVRIADEALAEELRTTYAPGAAVAVYYDPARPGRSVLRPGLYGEADAGVASCCTVLFLFLGFGGLFVAFRGVWRRRR